jgi:hypothetical protein
MRVCAEKAGVFCCSNNRSSKEQIPWNVSGELNPDGSFSVVHLVVGRLSAESEGVILRNKLAMD